MGSAHDDGLYYAQVARRKAAAQELVDEATRSFREYCGRRWHGSGEAQEHYVAGYCAAAEARLKAS